jgi:DNA-binding GntR family transcriptional regulator
MKTNDIVRAPLRDQVYDALVRRILADEFTPGMRLSDRHLSEELGVSRTPIRETLMRLAQEGFLEADLHRGCFVKPRTALEAREVYPVLWTLESLALRSSAPLAPATRVGLERLNRKLAAHTGEPGRLVELDMAWHRMLLSGCSNGFLLETIDGLKRLIRRYEYAFMQDAGRVPGSVATHEEILALAGGGDPGAAADLLTRHWRLGMEAVLDWLERA